MTNRLLYPRPELSMMRLFGVAMAIVLPVGARAHAAYLRVDTAISTDYCYICGPERAQQVLSVYLMGSETNLGWLRFRAFSDGYVGGSVFANLSFTGRVNGVARPAGSTSTFINAVLSEDPVDPSTPEGQYWSIVDKHVTAREVSFAGGPLGYKIEIPPSGLFLANLYTTGGAPYGGPVTVDVELHDATQGNVVGSLSYFYLPTAEPTAIGLGLLGLLALTSWRRRQFVATVLKFKSWRQDSRADLF